MNDQSSVSNRTAVDVAHFALCAAGLFVGSGGVVINSICVTLVGLVFVGLGLLYFLVTS